MNGKLAKSKSIRRFMGIFAAALLLLAVGWTTHTKTTEILTDHTRSELRERLSLFHGYLKNELNTVNLVVNILAENPNLVKTLSQAPSDDQLLKTNHILEAANDQLNTSDLFLLDKTGLTIAASNHEKEKSFIGKNYAFRPYFKQAVSSGQGAFLAHGVTSHKIGYYISHALYKDKKVIGIIVAKLNLDNLTTLSQDLEGDFFLVDEKGIIFFSSDKEMELKTTRTLSAEHRREITKTRQYPILRIAESFVMPSPIQLHDRHLTRIGTTDFLHEEQNIPEVNWKIWMLGKAEPVQNQAIMNTMASILVAFMAMAAFYLLYKRRQDLERFQTIVDNLPSGVTLFSSDLKMLMCNEKIKQVLDFPEKLFQSGMPSMQKLIDFNIERGEYGDGDKEELAKMVLDRINQRTNHTFERTRPNGTIVEVRGTWLKNNSFVTTYTDITERKTAEEKATRNAKYLQALLQHLDQGVTVTDENLNIVFWNKAFFKLLDLPDHLMQPVMRYEDLIRYNAERGEYGPGDPEQHVQIRIKASLKFEPHHFERTRADGHTLEVTGKPLEVDGTSLGFITTYVDITEHKRMNARLRKLANTDDMTELNNRRHFNNLLKREIKRCIRNGHPLSLLMLDLDHFKKINDKFGHSTGDIALKEFAKICKDVFRDIDIIGRMGGEEFAVFLPDTERKGAFTSAERLRKAVENVELYSDKGEQVNLRVSIGVSVYDATMEDTIDDLVKRADQALYRAKNQGRNRVC